MLSSVSEPGLEKVAEAAPDALRMYQLYVRGDDAFVEDRVSRAIANGYAAFCLTVDTAHYSRRERDIAKRYVRESRLRATGGDFQKGLEWRTVKLIKDKYKIPLVIKGIATAEDAAIASITASTGSMCPTTADASSITAAARCMCCPRSSTPCRPRQDHGRRLVLPRHRHRQGDRHGRRSRRHRPPAMLGAGRQAAKPACVRMLELLEDEVIRCARPARRHEFRRTRQILSAPGHADQPAPRLQRLPAAGHRALSLLTTTVPR